jgi:integrase
MALTDVAIRNAKPEAKAYKLADGAGMFLLVTPAGGKLWRLKYRIDGREKLLAIGAYPQTSLSDARKRREEARALIAQGKDPSREKQRDKARSRIQATDTFTAISNEYCAKRRRDGEKGWSPATAIRSEYLLSLLSSSIGRMPIADIEPADVLAAVRKIEGKGNLESARRTLQLASMVFRYAVATARLRSDPTRDLRGALTAPTVTHYGAITDAKGVGELLRAIDGYEGQGLTKLALQFAPHVFVRPGELRHAEWEEFDLDAGVWKIPAGKMKMGKAHHVPLSKQAIAILKELHAATGPTGYAFPSIRTRTRPMSENTLNVALRRLGYTSGEMTAHGFRAMASTLLNESGKWNPDAIERALAHADSDKVRAAYHCGAHWQERVVTFSPEM